MDRLNDYLRDNFKRALKSVRYNYKQYLCFFVAVFVVQMLFWSLTLAVDTDRANVKKTVEAHYDCHIIVRGMNSEQYAILNNKVYVKNLEKDRAFEQVTFDTSRDLLGRTTYNAYVVLSDIDSASSIFVREYINPIKAAGNTHEVIHTPLETYQKDYQSENSTNYWLLMLLMTALSVLLLMALYNIRINHYKFLYGIYMTCGANFRKLFDTAAWELLVVSLLTFVPAAVCAVIASALIYHAVGVSLKFAVSAIFKVLIFNFVAVLCSVWLPMKWMSVKAPMTLIVAQDNSNLVSSPRRSFRIFGRRMPFHYETFGMWRFRTYYIKLLAVATAFSALFLCGLYIRQMVGTRLEGSVAEFSVTSPESLDDDAIESFLDIPGVQYCLWENTGLASMQSDHLLLTREQGAGASAYTLPSAEQDGYHLAINSFAYTAFDKLLIDVLVENELVEIEGDPYAILTQEKTVLISDSLANTKCLELKPGDKVMLATFLYAGGNKIDKNILNAKDLLRQQIEKFGFAYTEYTVCAVIHGSEAGSTFTFGVNNKDFEALTGQVPVRQTLEIYTEQDISVETAKEAEGKIRETLGFYPGSRVTQSNQVLERQLKQAQNVRARVVLLSVLILIICPLVWFFSQILYFGKRKPEMDMLRSFGAVEKEIRGIYLVAGCYTAVASIVMTLLLAYTASGLLFWFCNHALAALGLGDGTRYAFYLSTPALLSCIGISMLCGFLSAYAPYWLYRIKRAREYRTGQFETDLKAE